METKFGRSGVLANEGDVPTGYKKEGGEYFFEDRKKGDIPCLSEDEDGKTQTSTMHIYTEFDKAVYPKLSDHTDLDNIDRMSEELKMRILEGARLTVGFFSFAFLSMLH